jgi:ATP-binding cassette subfamily F protein uup
VSIVSARHLSKAYGADPLFSDVSITVAAGERIGLLGANGAGKSTLLKVLAGLETADGGILERQRGTTVGYLAQEPLLDDASTPRQIVERGLVDWHAATNRYEELNRLLGTASADAATALIEEQAALGDRIEHLGGWTRDHVALSMLEHLGVREIDRPVKDMSGGERRRVALAELLVAEPSLVILDEPTNHLDIETIEWLEQHLASAYNGAVLLVTHDRYVLDAVAQRVLELDRGKITEFTGGYAGYLEQRAELMVHEGRVEQNRLNLLRRETEWLRRGAKARSTKQKARVDRARALIDVDGPKDKARASFAGLEAGAPRLGKTILGFEHVRFDIGGRTLIADLTLNLVPGERLGILGPNGVGKTSLLRLVSAELEPTAGKVVRGLNTEIVYFDQSRSQLEDDWSVFDNVAGRKGADRAISEIVQIGERSMELRTYLEQFLFEGSRQRQKVGALSGGERARVALAKALRTGANVLLLDEPTNDLDVTTLGALEELLNGWPGCAIVVSHDRFFLDRVATSTLAFEGDGKVTRYAGGYESYVLQRDQARAQDAQDARSKEPSAKPKSVAPPPPKPAVAAKPLTFAEKKELDGILDEVAALETKVSTLEARLADPSVYAARGDEGRKAQKEHADAALELSRRTTRWEELEARRDAKR